MIRGGKQRAYGALEDLDTELEMCGDDVIVRLADKSTLMRVVYILEEENVPYGEVLLKRPNLEDVFLKLTGRPIEGGELNG